jgi:hypothetical protein
MSHVDTINSQPDPLSLANARQVIGSAQSKSAFSPVTGRKHGRSVKDEEGEEVKEDETAQRRRSSPVEAVSASDTSIESFDPKACELAMARELECQAAALAAERVSHNAMLCAMEADRVMKAAQASYQLLARQALEAHARAEQAGYAATQASQEASLASARQREYTHKKMAAARRRE